MPKCFFPIGIALLLFDECAGLLSTGSIVLQPKKPVFLSKFCFDFAANDGTPDPGHIHMEFSNASPKIGTYEVIVFDDQSDSFPDESAYREWTCGSKSLQQSSKLTRRVYASDPVWKTTMRIVERIRPRWWYVAVLECSDVERKLDYTLQMINPRLGWQKELSMDQCGLTSMGIFTVAYLVLGFFQLKSVVQKASAAQSKHPLRLLLLSSIFFASLGLLAFGLDAARFTRFGESSASLHLVGKFLKACSKLTITLMLLLLSRGICITHQFRFDDLRILRILVPFFATCFALEAWGEYAQSRKYTTGFVYCTWVGAVLVFGELCLLGVYLKNLRTSYTSSLEEEKRQFYRFWGSTYSSAFLALPFAAVLAMILAPWVRAEVIFLLTNSVHFVLLLLLVVGLMPEKSHHVFCLDQEVLAKTIGTSSGFLSHIDVDSSPCLLKTRPSGEYFRKGGECSFGLDTDGSKCTSSLESP